METPKVIDLHTSEYRWVDAQFAEWIHSRQRSKDEGPVDVLMGIDEQALELGVKWVHEMARRFRVQVTDSDALEIFALCVAYRKMDGILPSETVTQALNACQRRAARVGQA